MGHRYDTETWDTGMKWTQEMGRRWKVRDTCFMFGNVMLME